VFADRVLHAAHVMPGAAQDASESGVQAMPVQQPASHDVASQVQLPPGPEQCWPGWQLASVQQLVLGMQAELALQAV